MKKISDEHGDLYQLEHGGYIQFMKFTPEQRFKGTTNEELIEVLLHRIEGLNNKMPCFENVKAMAYLAGTLDILKSRTNKRKDLGIEGNIEINH